MEQAVEAIADEVSITDPKKSVTTSNVYSADFTDCTSDTNNSFGKETYVIDWDDSEDSEASCHLNREPGVVHLCDESSHHPVVCDESKTMLSYKEHRVHNIAPIISQKCTFVAQEIFTQTSKTIMELAESDGFIVKTGELKTLQTQTSYISVTENKTIEYRMLSSNAVRDNDDKEKEWCPIEESKASLSVLSNSFEDKSSKFNQPVSDIEKIESVRSEMSSVEPQKIILNGEQIFAYTDREGMSSSCSDIEEDSLMESNFNNKLELKSLSSKNSDAVSQKSVNNEVDELYGRVSDFFNKFHDNSKNEVKNPESQWARALTPLTEESTVKKESIIDMSPCLDLVTTKDETNKDVVHMQGSCSARHEYDFKVGGKRPKKMKEPFKLPPIHNNKPTSLNFLLSANIDNISPEDKSLKRWEFKTTDLASGEHVLINKIDARLPTDEFQLPPIHLESGIHNLYTNNSGYYSSSSGFNVTSDIQSESINIQDKIKELKITEKKTKSIRNKSPSNTSSEWSKVCDASHKGCELLCAELLRKLKSSSWCEVLDTLEDLPKAMEKFWNVITELRIADLIRQVTVHVDSPRTQVACAACTTLAKILKNTNYTRKPDFYEAVTVLLVKTGSASRPVRRAANMALDEVVCGVDFTQAVTALCVHGVGHKSPLVRCAAARLLVVCCAVSGGGRSLLRSRPPSAATARRAALRALAELLQDRATDARKYAERLYAMLRPLSNFEAYFITDVDVELASSQMKKYDHLLVPGATGR